MMPPMQKMAAPLALASALCHIATMAVIMNMHIQLSTVQDTATGPHRALLDSDGDAVVRLGMIWARELWTPRYIGILTVHSENQLCEWDQPRPNLIPVLIR